MLQLILNPIRDWNSPKLEELESKRLLQLILNPIRDWNYPVPAHWLEKFGSN